ncbi:MAG: hypothetical protein KAS23_03455 [Anaerohalosphaera sp.]|nr:hypothetical protein [Anaerohalosphaera sp.]
MDELNKKIISELQQGFPLEVNPYDIIAGKLGISVDELWERVQQLVGEGVIRRIGVSLDSRKLGYASTLAAVCVAPENVDRGAEVVGRYPEVTHSYERKGEFNIWFTLIAVDNVRIEVVLEEIRAVLGLNSADVLNLPVLNLFKLDARFKAGKVRADGD